MPPAGPAPIERSRIRRQPDRGCDDRGEIDAVLDEGLVAHVGIAVESQPYVIPMSYGRDGDRLILHGSVASRLMRGLDGGLPVCVTVTVLDGLVLARSAFHHSMNYRSVVVFGTARRITEPDAAGRALDALVEHIVPGRSAEARPASAHELRRTAVLEVHIEEISMKVRTGGARDEADDLALPVWAGVLPLAVCAGAPESNADLAEDLEPSPSVLAWTRGGAAPAGARP